MSTLKVNTIKRYTGTDITIAESGDTVTIPTGAGLTVTDEVKTNKVSPATGVAFTVGDSGDTFNIVSGATLNINSGATLNASSATVSLPSGVGSLSWSTKTGAFDAAASSGYFVDTTSGGITGTLPATPSVADIIRFIDVSGTFDTNNLIVARNGKNIQGDASDMTVDAERAAFGLIFSGDTEGWVLLNV